VPAAAELLAVSVRVEEPEPLEMLAGLKLAVTPAGSPKAESATALLKLLKGAAVMVAVPDDPAATERVEALGVNVKFAGLPV
jgi:hypothetical protein